MADEREIKQAIGIITEGRRGIGKRHSRLHADQLEDNRLRQKALEGLCCRCVNLKIQFGRDDGRPVVGLGCRKGMSILRLYRFTEMGQEVQCDKHIPKPERV